MAKLVTLEQIQDLERIISQLPPIFTSWDYKKLTNKDSLGIVKCVNEKFVEETLTPYIAGAHDHYQVYPDGTTIKHSFYFDNILHKPVEQEWIDKHGGAPEMKWLINPDIKHYKHSYKVNYTAIEYYKYRINLEQALGIR